MPEIAGENRAREMRIPREKKQKKLVEFRTCLSCDDSTQNMHLIQCQSCLEEYHWFCASSLFVLLADEVLVNWHCRSCKRCQTCEKLCDDDTTVTCSLCCTSYHQACLDYPSTHTRSKTWTCSTCKLCRICQQPNSRASPLIIDSNICHNCKKAGLSVCPICKEDLIGDTAECRSCQLEYHKSCGRVSGDTCLSCLFGGLEPQAARSFLTKISDPSTLLCLFTCRHQNCGEAFLEKPKWEQHEAAFHAECNTCEICSPVS